MRFEEAYHSHDSGKGPAILDSHIIEEDLRFLTKIAVDSGFNGFVVMFDEAQVLEDQQNHSEARLHEIGKVFNISKQRVSTILKKVER